MNTGRVITCITRHIWKMPIMADKYKRVQIIKSTQHLKDIFKNTDQIRQDKIFNPSTTYTQMNTKQSDKEEDRMLDQHNTGISGDTHVADVRQWNDIWYESPEIKFTQYKQNSRTHEIRMRLGQISHKSERVGIEE